MHNRFVISNYIVHMINYNVITYYIVVYHNNTSISLDSEKNMLFTHLNISNYRDLTVRKISYHYLLIQNTV